MAASGMKLYITDLSLFVLTFLYLPLVLWGLLRIWRTPKLRGFKKAAALIVAVLLAYAIPLGDVTINSLSMVKACPSAGLRIYKTVEVEGYLTNIGDGDILKKRPYKFIEAPQLKTDSTYYWTHYEKLFDGTVSSKQLDQPTAVYESISVDWHMDKARGVEASAYIVRNRISGEVLAEWNLFNPLPGWLDKILAIRWFGTGGRDGCHGDPAYDFESKVLIPARDIGVRLRHRGQVLH